VWALAKVAGREVSVAARQTTPARVSLFSDGVFAVTITILVLELKPPSAATFSALLSLWPTGLRYAVSYLFIAYVPAPDFRVIQLTPQGAGTSIQFGVGLTDAPVGSVRGLDLVVPDIEACRRELTDRGVAVSEIRHKDTGGDWRGGFLPGLDPSRADNASFADFRDPDGNTRVLQERGHR
jgi:hypothetical protein